MVARRVGERARWRGVLAAFESDECSVAAILKIERAQGAIFDIEQGRLMRNRWRTLASEFKNYETSIMGSGKVGKTRVSGEEPESVRLKTVSEDDLAFLQIPDTEGFILTVWQNQLGIWMKKATRNVVEMTTKGVQFPRFVLIETP